MKPSHFLGNRGDIVIGDLGLSTTLRQSCAAARSIVGTVDFIAPEIYDDPGRSLYQEEVEVDEEEKEKQL